ncbi:MAG: FAD-dependent oxidoreductase, partial [Moraxellaceae bacterium]|nr:FAD-dependent oxidoreductase [Moraxellaceae bacterium]
EIYGLDHDPKRFEQTWLRTKTDIDGLYLTGQDIMTCGVVGAMIGGLMTAINIGGVKALPLAKKMFVG